MKLADASILIVPGFGNSGPDHWQTRWEQKLSSARRVWHPALEHARRDDWVEAVVEAVERAEKPVVLVAHSLGVIGIVHAASRLADLNLASKVTGAFLVAPSNVERDSLRPEIDRAFAPIPRDPLPFPSLLVASRNDPYCDFEVAADHANAWGSALVDAGEAGHINADSGHGPWPEGLLRFAGFFRTLKP
jgi:uncharacterized protein